MRENDLPKWWIWGMIVIIFAACMGMSSRLQLDERITSMLPDSNPVVKQYTFVAELFRIFDAIYVDIEAASNSPDSLKDAIVVADAIYCRLNNSKFFSSISYRFSRDGLLTLIDHLTSKTPRLIQSSDLAEFSEHLNPLQIIQYVKSAKQRLIEPSGLFLSEKIRRDPLEIDNIIFKKLEMLRAESEGAQIRDGLIWSADGRHILIIASPDFPAVDTVRDEQLVKFLRLAREQVLTEFPQSHVRISFAGTHIATYDNSSTIKGDVSRAVIALSLGILLLGFLVFRNRIFVLLIFLPAMFGMVVSSAVFAFIDPFFSAVALGCGSVLIGIAVDYGVHILFHIDSFENPGSDLVPILRRLVLPLSLGAGTTIAGFMGLMTSSLPGQRHMGLFASLGVLGAVLFALLVLKYCIPAQSSTFRKPVVPLVALCSRYLERSSASGKLWVGGIIVLAVCSFGLTKVRFEGDVSWLNHLSPEVQKDSDQFLNVWGNLTPTLVVVEGKTVEEALLANDKLFQILAELKAEGKLELFSSLSPILPSVKTQEANLGRWKSFWSPELRSSMVSCLVDAATAQGFADSVFEPFYNSIDNTPPPMTICDYEGTVLSQLINARITTNDKGSFVLSSFTISDRSMLDSVSNRITLAVPGTVVMDKRYFVEHMTSMIHNEFDRLVLVSCAAISLCLFIFLRRAELVLINLLPVGISVVITLGVLGLLNIPINLMSILFVVFIFGVGVDFSVFLTSSALDRYRGEGDYNAVSCASVIICALTTIGGFLTLVFAQHSALFSIGATGLIAMVSSLAAALLIVPTAAERLMPDGGKYGTPSLKTLGGAMWAFIYLAGIVYFYSCILRFWVMLRHLDNPDARKYFARRYMHKAAAWLIITFPYIDSKRIYIDSEPDRFVKPGIIVSNHLSAADIMLILALPTDMVMFVKRWVWEAPIMGRMVRDAGYLLVEEDCSEELLACSKQYLEKGVSIMVFPEGSRSVNGTMRRFHVGAFRLAVETESDIIPILLTDSQTCIPHKAVWIGDHQTVTHTLPRVTTRNFDYSKGARELSRHVRRMMMEYTQEDWRIAQAGKAFRHKVRALYNYRGPYVESYIAWKLKLDPIYGRIDDLVPETGTVLDIGSGYGLMSAILALKSPLRQVLGVDLDENKIRTSRKVLARLGNTNFIQDDFLKIDLPKVNAVLMIDVLHYWSEEQQLRIIDKACLSLEKGGVLVFREACKCDSPKHALIQFGEWFSVLIGHNHRGNGLHFMSREFYLRSFSDRGLQLVSEPQDAGRGSNAVLIFREGTECSTM